MWELASTVSNVDREVWVSIPVTINNYDIFYVIGHNNTSINYSGWTLYFWIAGFMMNNNDGSATFDPCTVQSSLFFREILADQTIRFRSCEGGIYNNEYNGFAKLASNNGSVIYASANQITVEFYGLKFM